jgi:8-oxo-dGTP pyrophosphatase MutT (NUDIX family)
MNSEIPCEEIRFTSEKDFHQFCEKIKSELSSREKKICSSADYRKASVLILLVNKNSSPHVILTMRTDKVSTHKGDVSFPGGTIDAEDENSLFTALRETCEEIGIPPEKIKVLGEFDEYISLAGFHVNVFAGAADYPLQYNLSEDEIDSILEVPLSCFCNEGYYKCDRFEHKGEEVCVYYYDYCGTTIWGMTARILTDFAAMVLKQDD